MSYKHKGKEINTLDGTTAYLRPDANGIIWWHIGNLTKDMPKAKVLNAAENAFDVWQPLFTPITFKKTDNPKKAHITIWFMTNNNAGLPKAFRPQELAYARSLGDVWVNDKWDWSKNGDKDLAATLAHELGHSFNLGHSDGVKDLMYREFKGTTEPGAYEKFGIDFLMGDIKKKFAKQKTNITTTPTAKAVVKKSNNNPMMPIAIIGIGIIVLITLYPKVFQKVFIGMRKVLTGKA